MSQKAVIREVPFVRRHGECVPSSQTQSHVPALYRVGVRHFVLFRAVTTKKVPRQYSKVSPNYKKVAPKYAKHPPKYAKMPPKYAKHPARYERMPPAYSRQPGKYERTPPTLERGPPMVKRVAPRRLRKVVSGFSRKTFAVSGRARLAKRHGPRDLAFAVLAASLRLKPRTTFASVAGASRPILFT